MINEKATPLITEASVHAFVKFVNNPRTMKFYSNDVKHRGNSAKYGNRAYWISHFKMLLDSTWRNKVESMGLFMGEAGRTGDKLEQYQYGQGWRLAHPRQ